MDVFGPLLPIVKGMYSGFRHYCKRNILDHLGVTSVQWTSIGVVSGNDYDKNIPYRPMVWA
jgi:hypothetical protein